MSDNSDTLKELFHKSKKEEINFTKEESERFTKAFDDPEFRSLLAEYMEDLQNPQYREENEAYISQLEGEKQVPQGKELIRPTAGFVAKTHKKLENQTEDKLFLNIVQSDKINEPTCIQTNKGQQWSLPYSLGPPHMEKDKNGENVTAFDCCFHPEAIRLCNGRQQFRDILVQTALEGVETGYKKQGQKVTINKDYRMLKGVSYKQGKIPTMMIDVGSKTLWDSKNQKNNSKDKSSTSSNKNNQNSTDSIDNNNNNNNTTSHRGGSGSGTATKDIHQPVPINTVPPLPSPPPTTDDGGDSSSSSSTTDAVNHSQTKPPPAIKKGFLNKSPSPAQSQPTTTKTTLTSSTLDTTTGTTSFQGSTFSSTSTTGSNNDSNITGRSPLVQEIVSPSVTSQSLSPASQDASLDNSTSTTAAGATTITSTPNVVCAPTFTVVERGIMSMGDFDSLRPVVTSRRPSELVYRFEVPLVAKASELVLDVAERRLSLHYKDIYHLTVDLPYPVHDKKGQAKYDKKQKTLTVTLPVVAMSAPDTSSTSNISNIIQETSSNPADANTSTSDTITELDSGGDATIPTTESSSSNSNSSNSSSNSSEAKVAANSSSSRKDSSRWVMNSNVNQGSTANPTTTMTPGSSSVSSSSSSTTVDDSQSEKELSLSERIRLGAEAATATLAATVTTTNSIGPVVADATANVKGSRDSELSPPIESEGNDDQGNDSNNVDFIARFTFAGRKPGYVFKTGPQGLGYYLDVPMSLLRNSIAVPIPIPVITAEKASISSTLLVVPKDIPIEFRETLTCISVLAQVPRIIPDTVDIRFHNRSFDVSFMTSPSLSPPSSSSANDPPPPTSTSSSSIPQKYCSGFEVRVDLNIKDCSFNVADRNMVILLTKKEQGYWDNNNNKTNTNGTTSSTTNQNSVTALVVPLPYHLNEAQEGDTKDTTTSPGKRDNNNSNLYQDTTTGEFTSLPKSGNKASNNNTGGKSSVPQQEEMIFSTGVGGSSSAVFELD